YDGCKSEIERRGGEVILRAPVRGLKIENGALAGIRFDEAREESADAYVFAVPHTALAELLPESVKQGDPSLANLDKIKVAPITGVHFWFDRQVMDEPFLTLLDTTTQWIFNKTLLYEEPSSDLDPVAAGLPRPPLFISSPPPFHPPPQPPGAHQSPHLTISSS